MQICGDANMKESKGVRMLKENENLITPHFLVMSYLRSLLTDLGGKLGLEKYDGSPFA